MCLFIICICSLVKCFFTSFAHFLTGLFAFLLLNVENPLYNLGMSNLSYVVCKYFLPVYGLSFHFLHKVFHRAKLFNFGEVSFCFSHAFVVKSKNCSLSPRSWRFSPMLFSKRFMALHFKYKVHFKLIFVYDVRFRLSSLFFFFFFLPVDVQLLQHHLLKKPSFLYQIAFAIL